MVAPKKKMAAGKGPIRNLIKKRLFSYIRGEAQAKLVEKGTYDPQTARWKAEHFTDEDIQRQLDKRKELAKSVGKLGDGGFWQWIMDHKDQILELVMTIVSLLSMFADGQPDPTPSE